MGKRVCVIHFLYPAQSNVSRCTYRRHCASELEGTQPEHRNSQAVDRIRLMPTWGVLSGTAVARLFKVILVQTANHRGVIGSAMRLLMVWRVQSLLHLHAGCVTSKRCVHHCIDQSNRLACI